MLECVSSHSSFNNILFAFVIRNSVEIRNANPSTVVCTLVNATKSYLSIFCVVCFLKVKNMLNIKAIVNNIDSIILSKLFVNGKSERMKV